MNPRLAKEKPGNVPAFLWVSVAAERCDIHRDLAHLAILLGIGNFREGRFGGAFHRGPLPQITVTGEPLTLSPLNIAKNRASPYPKSSNTL